MTLTYDQPLGTGHDSKAQSDEANREIQPSNSKLSAYERYVKYGRLPRRKNARKRVGFRVLKESQELTSKVRTKRINEAG